MKNLKVPFLTSVDRMMQIQRVSQIIDKLHRENIDRIPWPEFSYAPEVKFSLAYTHNCLFLKYYVSEAAIRAVYRDINDPVYKDSCVEFFIAFHDEKEYYNIEFNSLGTCRLGFGISREERIMLPKKTIRKITSDIVVRQPPIAKQSDFRWELTAVIPVEIFTMHTITDLSGLKSKANFYKCGDCLPTPHYVSWNDIKSGTPNFHLPEFFGEIQFMQ